MTSVDSPIKGTASKQRFFIAQSRVALDADATTIVAGLENAGFQDESTVMTRPGLTLIGGAAILEQSTARPLDFARDLASRVVNFDEIDAGKVVFFALLPFDPTSSETCVVFPRFSIVVKDGSAAICTAHPEADGASSLLGEIGRTLAEISDTDPRSLASQGRRSTGASDLSLDFTESDSSWLDKAERVIELIRAGTFEKVVLSRRASVEVAKPVDRLGALGRLTRQYPGALSFSFRHLLGATPELLVRRSGRSLQSHPLAGTTAAGNEAALLGSAKDNHEHRIVVDHIASRFAPITERLEVAGAPEITSYGEICHLGTDIQGVLPASMTPSSLEVLLAIHPTPAVAGVPQRDAIALLQSLEDQPRHFYSGAIGYETLDGDGEWHLVIRTVAITDCTVEFQAGVGIVAESDAKTELLELGAKLSAMLPIVTA